MSVYDLIRKDIARILSILADPGQYVINYFNKIVEQIDQTAALKDIDSSPHKLALIANKNQFFNKLANLSVSLEDNQAIDSQNSRAIVNERKYLINQLNNGLITAIQNKSIDLLSQAITDQTHVFAREVKEILLNLESVLLHYRTVLFVKPQNRMPESFQKFFSKTDPLKSLGRLLIINNLSLGDQSRHELNRLSFIFIFI